MAVKISAKQKTIDGKKVVITPFFAIQANILKFKLLTLMGKSLLSVIGELMSAIRSKDTNSKNEDLLSHIDIDKFAEAFNQMLDKTTPEYFQEIIEEILSMTFVDNICCGDDFNGIFTCEYSLMYKCIFYALEVNYKSFLDLVDTGKNRVVTETTNEDDSQKKNRID